MSPKQFRPIILKTLKEGKKFQNFEALADHLCSRMEAFKEMADLLINDLEPQRKDIPVYVRDIDPERRVLLPTDSVREDPSERILPQTKNNAAELKEYFDKDEIYAYLNEKLPNEIEVQPNGFAAPVKLFRRLQKAPGDLTFVKILFVPAGASQGVEVQAATTDQKIDDAAIMESIRSQAMAVLSPTQRNIPPRMTIPPPQSLSPDPGFSVETDRETSASDWTAWNGKR